MLTVLPYLSLSSTIPMSCSEYIPQSLPLNSNGESVVEVGLVNSVYSKLQTKDTVTIEVSYGLEAVRVMSISRSLLAKIRLRSTVNHETLPPIRVATCPQAYLH